MLTTRPTYSQKNSSEDNVSGWRFTGESHKKERLGHISLQVQKKEIRSFLFATGN